MKDTADTGHPAASLMLMDGGVPAWKLHTQAFGFKSHIDKPFLAETLGGLANRERDDHIVTEQFVQAE